MYINEYTFDRLLLQSCFQVGFYYNSCDDIKGVKVSCSPVDQGFMEIFIFLRNDKRKYFCGLITSKWVDSFGHALVSDDYNRF